MRERTLADLGGRTNSRAGASAGSPRPGWHIYGEATCAHGATDLWSTLDGPALIAVLDHGFTVGDGVFEAIKVVDNSPFALTRHLRPSRVLGEGPRAARARRRPGPEGRRRDARGPAARATAGSGSPTPPASRRSAPAAAPTSPTLAVVAAEAKPFRPPTKAVVVPVAAQREGRHSRAQDHVVRRERGRSRVRRRARRQRGDLRQHGRQPLRGHRHQRLLRVRRHRGDTAAVSAGCLAGRDPRPGRRVVRRRTSATSRWRSSLEADEVFFTSTTRDVQSLHDIDGRAPRRAHR